jgi:galactose mutarotase-like enzyme
MNFTEIKNDVLCVTISTRGAEMHSVKYMGKERLFNNPDVWGFHAPVLFPICSGLKNDRFIYGGKEYILNKHGYTRTTGFTLESNTDTSATYLLTSDETSKKVYPFDYELRITYTLDENRILTTYNIKNTGDNTMYFSIGSHEAYDCPEGVENYSVVFEYDEPLLNTSFDGTEMKYEKFSADINGNELHLSGDLFYNDALIFHNLKSKKATLKNNISGETATVEFPDCQFFLIWQKPHEKFICLEPWSGFTDWGTSDPDITKKPYATALDAGKTYQKQHIITFN